MVVGYMKSRRYKNQRWILVRMNIVMTSRILEGRYDEFGLVAGFERKKDTTLLGNKVFTSVIN